MMRTRPGTSGSDTAEPLEWVVFPAHADEDPGRELIGGKAWSLWRMNQLGLRVPPSFVVTTRACTAYFDQDKSLPDGLVDELRTGIRALEAELGRTFGGTERPLLVSVRSGAAVSMPGMMDTILNLGINDDIERALAVETRMPEFAAEVNRRFHAFYGQLVLGCFEELGDLPDTAAVRAAISEETTGTVPTDPWAQLEAAVGAVFASSRTRRAMAYREHHGIPHDLGTAVTVQAMVFGNADDRSGTGVLFSRNPLSGSPEVYGEYLPCGQGEDVVSGKVSPLPLDMLAERSPTIHAELIEAADLLDREGRDAQDIEFTVECGTLYLLQSRPAKRTARAAVRIALELVDEGVIDIGEALARVTPDQLRAVLRPVVASGATDGATALASGSSASPGVATGLAVATPEEAEQVPGSILVRRTTSPEDVHGMIAAAAVVTELGGSTSHAAVVSRALDTPCVVGCDGALEKLVGKVVTVDASAGVVYAGELPTVAVDENDDPDLVRILAWAAERSPITVVPTTGEAPEPLLDVTADPELDPETVPPIPEGTASVHGPCFGTPEGLRAALAAGVHTLVADPALPVLLTALNLKETS
ncbi:pyruvate, phosphate dikinase [Nocardioides sp. NPDC101246]|uniref:pyruvate, phosphate dikinase n=1 Tax=Nocardioides sp. NPDC101246 TaxID=3364336 RepID=UPI0037F9E40F